MTIDVSAVAELMKIEHTYLGTPPTLINKQRQLLKNFSFCLQRFKVTPIMIKSMFHETKKLFSSKNNINSDILSILIQLKSSSPSMLLSKIDPKLVGTTYYMEELALTGLQLKMFTVQIHISQSLFNLTPLALI